MIDLEKEREVFKQKMLKDHCDYKKEQEFEINRYGDFSWIGTNSDFDIWQMCAEEKQKEISKLKQKLEKIESGEFVLLSKFSVSSIVLDEDTINLDDEITKLSSDFSEKCFLDGEQEEDIEMLIAKSMKLGELYERKRWQKAMIEAVEKDHE